MNVARWVFQEIGAIEVTSASHRRVSGATIGSIYRIKDEIEFTAVIREWNGNEWVPFRSNDVQIELVRLDPWVRVNFPSTPSGVFALNITLPDVYGVFTFRIIHNKLGYSYMKWQEVASVRPFRHDEYERFIPAAYPYYASAFSMIFGFYLFTFLFLYHQSPTKKNQNRLDPSQSQFCLKSIFFFQINLFDSSKSLGTRFAMDGEDFLGERK
jgi:oligosaccharyltransferase complex subunit beta